MLAVTMLLPDTAFVDSQSISFYSGVLDSQATERNIRQGIIKLEAQFHLMELCFLPLGKPEHNPNIMTALDALGEGAAGWNREKHG